MKQDFTLGEHVWAQVDGPSKDWLECTVASVDSTGAVASVSLEGGKVTKPLKVLGKNPQGLIGSPNLIHLSLMSEQEVLRSLKARYLQDLYYTRSGLLMVSVNPFKQVPGYYSWQKRDFYRGKATSAQRDEQVAISTASPEPHLYEVAQSAYHRLKEGKINQSIIINGESGAGKTVAARHILQFLTEEQHQSAVGSGSGSDHQSLSKLEQMILASNPLLESLGNAKTQRNNNSSRFGKFVKLEFGDDWTVCGASIQSFLLEKSRACSHAAGERNFHIFYQLIAGLDEARRKELHLQKGFKFSYLEPLCEFDEQEDLQGFSEFMKSLDLFGLDCKRKQELLQCLAGILHLGNVEIKGSVDDSSINESNEALCKACELLGFEPRALIQVITERSISTREGTIVAKNSLEKALEFRDSLTKYLYDSIFYWMVSFVNKSISVAHSKRFIGILDIYGFEFFKTNSLEQFCINYANEKLQQEFNKHFFKTEQELYQREGVSMENIQFSDNQLCIDMIEAKGGIIDQLDEQSKVAIGTDQKFRDSLYHSSNQTTCNSAFLIKPKIGTSAFGVKHFAAEVLYESKGFLEKNRDTLPESLKNIACASKLAFLQEAIALSNSTGKKTVLSSFRDSLKTLLQTLQSTESQYIRCIKPNDAFKNEFDTNYTLNQLICCGIIESVKIAMQGYPTRKPHLEFLDVFGVLAPKNSDPVAHIKGCFMACGIDQVNWAVGKSQVFMKIGILAELELKRQAFYAKALAFVFSNYHTVNTRKRYLLDLKSVKSSQCIIKRYLMQSSFASLKSTASFLQSITRRKTIKLILKPLVKVQRSFRALKAREALNFHSSIIRMQSLFRVLLVRANFNETLRCIQIQRCFRTKQNYLPLKAYLQDKYVQVIQKEFRKAHAYRTFNDPSAIRIARKEIAQTKKRLLDAILAQQELEAQKAAQEVLAEQQEKRERLAIFNKEIKALEREEHEIEQEIEALELRLKAQEGKAQVKEWNLTPKLMKSLLKQGMIFSCFWLTFDTFSIYLTHSTMK
jgi:myosin-5